MIARFRSAKQQRGQIMVLFALLLPVLVGMMGLGIDAAHIFQERRDLQSVADLSALAGASQLPDDPSTAQAVAQDIAVQNGAAAGEVTTVGPYDGNDNQIEVTINREIDLFFMPVLGLDSVSISARAVAEHEVGGTTSILAKKDYHCWEGTVTWSGSNITVEGTVHSNGALTVTGNNNTLSGKITYKTGPPVYPHDGWTDCGPDNDISGTNPGIEIDAGPWQDWPMLYSRADFPCTYDLGTNGDLERNGPWWEDGTMLPKKQLNPGVICLSGSNWLFLEENDVSGSVTFVAEKIDIGGTNTSFTAYSNDVLFFSDGKSFPTMTLDPVGGSWEGLIYNRWGNPSDTVEGGQIQLTGGPGFQLAGGIVGWAVTLGGGNYTITGPSGTGAPEPMRLVE